MRIDTTIDKKTDSVTAEKGPEDTLHKQLIERGIEKADFKPRSHYASDEIIKKSFDNDDKNKDGYLTPEDKIGKVKGDTNKDGSLNKEEFMSIVDPAGTPFDPSEREQTFYQNDRNHDGLINILDSIPADFNGDGKLSFDEIKENFYKAYPPDDPTWGGEE